MPDIRTRRAPPVALGYLLSEITIPQDFAFSQQSLEKLDIKAKSARHHITEDLQIKELLLRLPKQGLNSKLNPQSDKAAYDKWIVDLNISTLIDRKLIEFLNQEAIQIFRRHQEAKMTALHHRDLMLKKLAEKLQQQDSDYEKERDAMLQRLYDTLSQLDNSVIKLLEDCVNQINFLNDKIEKINKQKEMIYQNLGSDVLKTFGNVFRLDPNLPPEKQAAIKQELGQAFNNEIIPLHNELNQHEDNEKKIKLQREKSSKVLNMMAHGKDSPAEDMLDVLHELVTPVQEGDQEDFRERAQKLVDAKQEELNKQLEVYDPRVDMPPILTSEDKTMTDEEYQKIRYQVNPEVEREKQRQKEIEDEEKQVAELMHEVERLAAATEAKQLNPDSPVNIDALETETDRRKAEEQRRKEEEAKALAELQANWDTNVEYGPPTFHEHLTNKYDVELPLITGVMDEKLQIEIENMVKKDKLEQQKKQLKEKLAQFQDKAKDVKEAKEVLELKKAKILNIKDKLVQKNPDKVERLNQQIKDQEEELIALNENMLKLQEKLQIKVAKLYSLCDPTSPALDAAQAAAMAADVRAGLNQHPNFGKSAQEQIRACEASVEECEEQIKACQRAAADAMEKVAHARVELISECEVAGASASAGTSPNPRIEELSAMVQARSAGDVVQKRTNSMEK
ncbi:MAG: hypothetical protein JSR17_09030 [Proteobacteria bacterium]|nr:hypothetical protein [Pseudomonadota bacterium]